MPDILFDTTHITRDELELYTGILRRLVTGEIGLKKLIGITHEGQAVYRLKLDKKNRLAFRFIDFQGKRVPLILASNPHNYGKLRKQLSNPSVNYIDSYSLLEEHQADETPLTIKPAVTLSRQILVLDEHQYQALQYRLPLLLMGPPGSGKTVLLFQLLKRMLHIDSAKNQTILYVSRSRDLLDKLNQQLLAEQIPEGATVLFKTWTDLLHEAYPQGRLARYSDFTQWLGSYKKIKAPAAIIYYELSLIHSMQEDQYLKLGLRQSHASGNPELQKMLIALLPKWREHLVKNKLYDEMISHLPSTHRRYDVIFCDEMQNLSPVTIDQLMKITLENNFVGCLDTEQNVHLAGNFLGGIKAQMHQNFGKYTKVTLPTVWRSDPEIIAVANKVLEFKYSLAGKSKRRIYSSLKSAMPNNKGSVEWVKLEALNQISFLTNRVTPVIYSGILSPKLKSVLAGHNFHYVLTPEQAIGLEFDQVICVNFWSQGLNFFTKKNQDMTLSPENEIRINKLFVMLTRAVHEVYFIDEMTDFANKINQLLNLKLMQYNQEAPSPEGKTNPKEQWGQLVEHHLKKGEYELARTIMSTYLQLNEQDVQQHLNQAQPPQTNRQIIPQPSVKKSIQKKVIVKNEKELTLSQKEVPVKPKLTSKEYCQGLMDKLTLNNLKNLFAHERLISLLFDYPLNDGDILFTHLNKSKFKKEFNNLFMSNRKKIFDALSIERLIKPVDSIYTEPLFFHLCRSFYGIGILDHLATTLYMSLPYDILFYKMPAQSRYHPNTTPFFWLSISTMGQEFLYKILKINHKLILKITAKDIASHAMAFRTEPNLLSPLDFLSLSLCGHKVIKILANNTPLMGDHHLNLSNKMVSPKHTLTTSFSAKSLWKYLQQLQEIFLSLNPEDLAIIHLANEQLTLSLSFTPNVSNSWHLLDLDHYPTKFFPSVGTELIDAIYEGFSRTCSDTEKFILNSTVCLIESAMSTKKIQIELKKIRIKFYCLEPKDVCPLMATYDDVEGIKTYLKKMTDETKKICLEKAIRNNSLHVFNELFPHAFQNPLEADFIEQLLQTTLLPDAVEIYSVLMNYPCFDDDIENDITQFALQAIRFDSVNILKNILEFDSQVVNSAIKEHNLATFACLYNRGKILDLLITKGLDVNAQADEKSPLHIAAQEGYLALVKKLIHAHADLNIQGALDATPLFLAVYNGHEDIVELLLKCGADIKLPGKFTAKSLSEFLKAKGVDYPVPANENTGIFQITPRKIARILRLDSIVRMIDEYKPKKNFVLFETSQTLQEDHGAPEINFSTIQRQ